jgi:hypothetical protein
MQSKSQKQKCTTKPVNKRYQPTMQQTTHPKQPNQQASQATTHTNEYQKTKTTTQA